MPKIRERRLFDISAVYLANLFVSFHYFLIVYVNSSFLSQYLSEKHVSLLYIVGSVLSVVLFAQFTGFLKKFGNYRLISIFIFLEALSLLGLAYAHSALSVILFFTVYLALSPIIYLNLDIFLETFITNERFTGSMRGLFLTMINIAQVTSPVLAGTLLSLTGSFGQVYMVSACFILVGLGIITVRLRGFKDSSYERKSLRESILYIAKHPTLYHVFIGQFLLRFFYAWMVIYMPLYLSRHIGFSWQQIGLMFSIMLIPFLLLELPLGEIADHRFGERGIMVIGFIIMALSVALVPFITIPNFLLWTIVLFASRVGASCTEVATESYFFKRVDSACADTISLFRVARPGTYVAAAIVASLALQVVSLQWSFLVLAVIMLVGIPHSLALKTKV